MHAPRRTSPPSTSVRPFQLQPSSLSLPTASFCCLCVRLPATMATPLAPYDHRRTSLNIKPTRATQHPLDHMIELPTHGSKLGYSFASCSYDLAVPWSEAPGARWTQRQLDTPSPGRGFQLFVPTQHFMQFHNVPSCTLYFVGQPHMCLDGVPPPRSSPPRKCLSTVMNMKLKQKVGTPFTAAADFACWRRALVFQPTSRARALKLSPLRKELPVQ